jgi:membrane associated rhomboid family serine protease
VNRRQPVFNAPSIVLALLAAFFAVHAVRALLPEEKDMWLTVALAFTPARYAPGGGETPGGALAGVASFATHIFVHGDLMHLLVNSAWLLAFGTPVARRTSKIGFLTFFVLGGAGGALVYLAVHPGSTAWVVGASGAISGLMGAALRFLFQAMDERSGYSLASATERVPLKSLAAVLVDRRIRAIILGWAILNVLLAWGASGLTQAAGIAWEAHLGGFFAGLLTFGFFDRAVVASDATPAGE